MDPHGSLPPPSPSPFPAGRGDRPPSPARCRVPASRRLLSAGVQSEPQFAVLPFASSYQPSRRREEARALQNLRRRVQAGRAECADEAARTAARDSDEHQQLDNRPLLLQKVRRSAFAPFVRVCVGE